MDPRESLLARFLGVIRRLIPAGRRHCRAAAWLWLALLPTLGQADALTPWRALGWETQLSAAWQTAHGENRPVLLYFHAPWCTWCQRYEAEVLRRPAVVAALRRRTVPLVLDYDAHPDLFSRYGGRGLPFIVVLADPDTVLSAFSGILSAEDLLDVVAAPPAPRPPPQARYPQALTAVGLARFHAAFQDHLETLYDPQLDALAGRTMPRGSGSSAPRRGPGCGSQSRGCGANAPHARRRQRLPGSWIDWMAACSTM